MILNIKPFSTNDMWQGRRFMTNEYKQWREEVLLLLKNHPKNLDPPYKLTATFHSNYDLSNNIKSIEDAIVKAGIIKDDRYIVEMHIKKAKAKRGEEFIDFMIESIAQ